MTEITPLPATPDDAVAVKETAAAARADLTRRTNELRQRQSTMKADLEKRRAEMEAEFRRQAAELQALMAPMEAELKKMTEVLWTVNLYLGRDETLTLLRDGEPAPADTPLTIRQRVLVMAEESLILTGGHRTGMTSENIPEFVDWLLEDDAHLDRVLPEPKGVVVMIPTKVKSRTSNPWEDSARDARNQSSYWLLRNGARIYLLTVDESLTIGERLLPYQREFIDVFDGGMLRGEVEPGSEKWLALEAAADARRRHYMRIILVLQGIIDRTTAWQPLPPAGLSLLRLEDQEAGRVVIVQDGDPSLMLTDGRESFGDWQKRLNALLRPGLRVVGNWDASGFRDLYEDGDRWTRGRHPRMSPPNVDSRPDSTMPQLIEDRRDGGFVIRFARTDEVWRRNVPVPDRPGYVYGGEHPVTPKQRASLLIMPTDGWVLPFDLATVSDLEYYLNSRDNRSEHFLSMVPTIHAALEAKRAEAQTEAPFRVLLGDLLRAEGADERTVHQDVEELVQWWKLAKTWSKPLNGDPAHERKAALEIVAEYKSRQRARGNAERVVAAARARNSGTIAVARNRQGQWFSYAPSLPAHDEGVFLDITRHRADGTVIETRESVTIPQRSASLLDVVWQSDEWKSWKFAANPAHYLTATERQQVVDSLLADAEGLPIAVTETFDPRRPGLRTFELWSWANGAPETTDVRPARDVLDGHGSSMTSARGVHATKDRAGQIALTPKGMWGASFARYTPNPFDRDWAPGTPWWPDDAPTYGVRARLAWLDEAVYANVVSYAEACHTAWRAKQVEDRRREVAAYRYVRPVQALIMAKVHQEARERFEDDYGRDADDLWDAHLASLNLSDPIHPRTFWGLFAIRLERGLPITGETLGSLADYAHTEANNRAPGEWHPGRGRQDLQGYDDLIVPEPEPEEAS